MAEATISRKMNKYRRWHNAIIERAKERKLKSPSERHHIVPRSLGGGNGRTNIVQLTYREHFLVHWLLTKIVRGRNNRRKMLHAFARMGGIPSRTNCRAISSWQFDRARLASAEASRLFMIEDHAKKEKSNRAIAFEKVIASVKFRKEQSRRFSRTLKQLWDDPDYYENGSVINRKRQRSRKVRKARSIFALQQWSDPNFAGRNRALLRQRNKSQEQRRKVSLAKKRYWAAWRKANRVAQNERGATV